ncbi:MAG: hypothetical protein ACLQVM_27725 [Terriglobia bacterium]
MRVTTVVLLASVLFLVPRSGVTQMADPALDEPGQPFTYASAPTDQMTVLDAPLGTEITPEGYLYTGYGELMFLMGNPPKAASQRTRTLEKGYLPVFHYAYRDGALQYELTTFAHSSPVKGEGRRLLNFVRIAVVNSGTTARTSYFNVAFRYTGKVDEPNGQGNHRFYRPSIPAKPGDYSQPGVKFDPEWTYEFRDDLAIRAGKVVYEFTTSSQPTRWLTCTQLYTRPEKMNVLPDTPVLMVQYALHLPPGGRESLVLKMPVQPIAEGDTSALSELRATDFDTARAATVDDWEKILGRGVQIQLPEKKVSDTFRASLVYDLMARDHAGEDYIQTVNKLQYHAFWLRDGAHIMSAYNVAGYPDLVRQSLRFFLKFQEPNGLFISQQGQYDGWGQTLWAFGRYYRFSHDRAFAEEVFPAVQRAMKWLHAARQADPLHLMPATNPRDAEFTRVAAHVAGHNFWALAGLRGAVVLANAVGATTDAKEYQAEYDDYYQALFKKLDVVVLKTGGYVPPGLDVPGGQDWGNMDTLYPEILMPPFDPKVAGTLKQVRSKYGEGLMTYAGWLHHYITMKNTEAELIRGEQQQVLRDLYTILVHTSSTQAGWEVGPLPWSTCDFGGDLAPHGWFAAEYVILLRNMLIREQNGELHLLSALSPEWCKPGDEIEVANAPTEFGSVRMKAVFQDKGMTLDLLTAFDQTTPERVVLHLPWFVTVQKATADGKSIPVQGDYLILPKSVRIIKVEWARKDPGRGFNYNQARDSFLKEYRQRYAKFLREGSPTPTVITVE